MDWIETLLRRLMEKLPPPNGARHNITWDREEKKLVISVAVRIDGELSWIPCYPEAEDFELPADKLADILVELVQDELGE